MINKKYILLFLLVTLLGIVANQTKAQSTYQPELDNSNRYSHWKNLNYTITPATAIKRLDDLWQNSNNLQESVEYKDALGRNLLGIQFNIKDTLDLVQTFYYDENGRPTRVYLPFSKDVQKGYIENPIADQASFYNNSTSENIEADSKPYSINEVEASLLGRLIKTTGPGEAWHTNAKTTSYSYRLNNANEVLFLDCFTSDNVFTVNGYYTAGNLTVTETTSPEGLTLKEYKDAAGRVILSDQDGLKTYFIYDDYGRLEYVLPPLAVEGLMQNSHVKTLTSSTQLTAKDQGIDTYVAEDNSIITLSTPFRFTASAGNSLRIKATSRLYFRYIYDDYNRLITRYQPSRESEEFVYDKLNRPIMYRDGNLRKDGKWKYIKYDALGRTAYWGVITSSTSRAVLQNGADNTQGLSENFVTDNYTYNLSYPTVTASSIMEEYVYDNPFTLSPAPPANEGFTYSQGSAKGLITRVRSRVLDESTWISSYFYYDSEGRLAITQRINELRTTNQRTHVKYNFAGQVIETRFIHCENNVPQLTLYYYYAYNTMGQVQSIDLEILGVNSLARNQIVSYEYNALGELVKRNLGQNGTNTYLQQVDYFYNLRGWLTSINNVDETNSADLFSQKLHYNDGLANLNGTARYDGLVSANEWKVNGNNNYKMAYGYQYDTHGRLTSSKYASGANLTENVDGFNESFTYDSNGNIKTLQRKGKLSDNSFNPIDNLTYTYSGNQLANVNDATASTLGFKDVASSGAEYTYDSNGNMKTDANRGITGISYNMLNLPKTATVVVSSVQTQYTFTYSASGEKLKVVDQVGTSTKTLYYDGPLTFEGNLLRSIATPEGRINSNGYSTYVQEYTITDNQGNVRVTFDKGINNTAHILNERHYYPSGLDFLRRNNSAVNHFGFGGKEEYEDPLGWLDFHARMYDPTIARWHAPDPLAEQTPFESPYLYCGGNPVNFIDPSGMETEDPKFGYDYLGRAKYDENGLFISFENRPDVGGYTPITENGQKIYYDSKGNAFTFKRKLVGQSSLNTTTGCGIIGYTKYEKQYLPDRNIRTNSEGDEGGVPERLRRCGMCHSPGGRYYDDLADAREAFGIILTGLIGIGLDGVLNIALVTTKSAPLFTITNQSASKSNVIVNSGKASSFYKELNPAWNGTMPKIGYEGFKAANGIRVWMYPAQMSNQGMATIKITSSDYQLILRFIDGL